MKGIRKITLALLSVVAMSIPVITVAAVPVPYGWYVEGNAGASKASGVSYGSGASVSGWGFGWNGNGGYKFSPFFAGEVGYTRYATTTITNAADINAADAKHSAIDLVGKGILPISNTGAELFAKLGASYIHTQVSTTNQTAAASLSLQTGTNNQVGWFVGAGADYSILPQVPVSLQWGRTIGNDRAGNLDLVSLGVAYIFD